MILNESLSKLIKYRGTSGSVIHKGKGSWLFKTSEGKYNQKAFRTIEKHFKKHDLDLDDVAYYNNMSDEVGWGKEIYTPEGVRKEAMKKGSPKDFSDFDRADEIYLSGHHNAPSADFHNNFVTLNKKLDTLKNKKDPAFKGKENGVELFEIDGSPIIRKTDHSWADDIGESMADIMERRGQQFQFGKLEDLHLDKVILMPNNKGIAKLNK